MNKLYRYIAALCLLLALCGCGRTQQTPATQPTQPEATRPRPGILSDAGQAETLQDYYSRTAVIGRNEWMEGSFIQTENWAREYAALEYPGGTVTVEYNSGYALPDAMTRDDLSGGVALWDVTVQWPDQPTVWETVQVFYFTESGENGQKQCFSGLLTGEELLKTKPEAYAYLALDTRFASRMQALPQLEAPAGAQTQELNFFAGGIDPQDCQVWMLTPADAIILSRYKEGELPAGNYTLTAYNLDTGVVDWELADLEDIWNYDSLEKGVLTLRQFLRQGEGRILRVWMEEGRPQWGLFDAPEEGSRYTVGDYELIWQDGSILLGEEVLLAGSMGQEPEGENPDETEMALYNFHQALDDSRFLFSKAGWEWIEYYGVYDLETRQAHVLSGSTQAWDYEIVQISADGSRALAWSRESNWLELVDLSNYTARTVSLPSLFVEQVSANADLTRVALLQSDMETGDYVISVVDSADGTPLFTWNVPEELVAGAPVLHPVEEHLLVVSLRQWKTDTEWLYRCRY